MNFKEIQELIRIVDESNLTTVEVEQDGFKIVLKKKTETIISQARTDTGYNQHFGGQPAINPISSVMAGNDAEPPAGIQAEGQDTVKSPIVGTFYSSSAPGEPPFVTPGTKADKGKTLCIIEAMKLMNEIEAEEDMIILEVLVQDGQMIEYGQPLYLVKKA